ncbi:LytR/AlgR family response regulator transcription factor [Persicitalea sp.]|uniref:LytR/AlgR family response regulator transcription factor n=1 Tax=Persicitalea sp. TaxID=3100273 RepID=UPI0035933D0F
MLKTFLLEDNAAELATVQRFLAQQCPGVSVVGTAREMQEAYDGILRTHPDLLISDIQLIGGRCYDLLNQLKATDRLHGLRLIFMTGVREFSIARDGYAFAPVAFLEKPFTAGELQAAVAKVEKGTENPQTRQQVEMLLELLAQPPRTAQRLTVSLLGGTLRLVELRDIGYLEADDGMARLYLQSTPDPAAPPLISNKPLGYYRTLLADNPRFFPISNSQIINLDHFDRYDHGERLVYLRNPSRRLYASRSGARALRELLLNSPLT